MIGCHVGEAVGEGAGGDLQEQFRAPVERLHHPDLREREVAEVEEVDHPDREAGLGHGAHAEGVEQPQVPVDTDPGRGSGEGCGLGHRDSERDRRGWTGARVVARGVESG